MKKFRIRSTVSGFLFYIYLQHKSKSFVKEFHEHLNDLIYEDIILCILLFYSHSLEIIDNVNRMQKYKS